MLWSKVRTGQMTADRSGDHGVDTVQRMILIANGNTGSLAVDGGEDDIVADKDLGGLVSDGWFFDCVGCLGEYGC